MVLKHFIMSGYYVFIGRERKSLAILDLFFLGFGVAMDATAISACKGQCIGPREQYKTLILPLLFGLFQFIMPMIGYFVGDAFTTWIHPYDHYVAFLLLLYIGVSMVYGSFKKKEEEACKILTWKEMILLAIATSLDALAVGASLAFVSVNIWLACIIMGVVTFICSLFGIHFGIKVGKLFSNKAEFVGGITLVAIAVKILMETW